MHSNTRTLTPGGRLEAALLQSAGDDSCDDLHACDELRPAALWDNLWDAFELDDEAEESQPEHGDFWYEPDEEEI